MSVLINKDSKIVCQGITGSQGTFHTEQCIQYGTQVVGGVTPGRGGEEHLGVPVFDTMREAVSETGADLPMLLALYSSFRDRPLQGRMVCFGEVGLSGEVRPVPDGEHRLKEAARHGFELAIVPKRNVPRKPPAGLQVVGVSNVAQALERLG